MLGWAGLGWMFSCATLLALPGYNLFGYPALCSQAPSTQYLVLTSTNNLINIMMNVAGVMLPLGKVG